MIEIFEDVERDIYTKFVYNRIIFLGATKRITTNIYNKMYDTKVETTCFYIAGSKPFITTTKREYKEGNVIRVRYTAKTTSNINIVKDKKDTSLRYYTTHFFIPNSKDHIVDKLNPKDYEDFLKHFCPIGPLLEIYGNDFCLFIKDDGFCKEKNYGLFLREENFLKVSRDEFVNSINKAYEGMII